MPLTGRLWACIASGASLPATAENPRATITSRREIVRVILDHPSCCIACHSVAESSSKTCLRPLGPRDHSNGPTVTLLILYTVERKTDPLANPYASKKPGTAACLKDCR